jgi:hypothetical protein
MRGYTVAASAVTLRVSAKWLDNVLSHHSVPGVQHTRQGVKRLLPPSALIQLEIALVLSRALAVPLGVAIPFAIKLHQAGGRIDTAGLPPVTITLDLPRLTSALDRRLADAVESGPSPKRGRPPRTKAQIS